MSRFADETADIFVPHLCDVEVLSVLRRAIRLRHATLDRAEETLRIYVALPLNRVDHAPLLGRALQLRDHFSAYDAVYVALAEGLAATLVTADKRLARSVLTWTSVKVVEVRG